MWIVDVGMGARNVSQSLFVFRGDALGDVIGAICTIHVSVPVHSHELNTSFLNWNTSLTVIHDPCHIFVYRSACEASSQTALQADYSCVQHIIFISLRLMPPAFPGLEMCGSTATSTTSVPTPAAPPAPVADICTDIRTILAPAPEAEPRQNYHQKQQQEQQQPTTATRATNSNTARTAIAATVATPQ